MFPSDTCSVVSILALQVFSTSSRNYVFDESWRFGGLEILEIGNLTKFDVEDGEICNMDAQTQDGSGEIQKTPTT